MKMKLLSLLVMLSLLVVNPQVAAADDLQITPFWITISRIACGWSIDSSGYASGEAWSDCYQGYTIETLMSLRQMQSNGSYIQLYSWLGPRETYSSYVEGRTSNPLPSGYVYTMFVTATAYLNNVRQEQVTTAFRDIWW